MQDPEIILKALLAELKPKLPKFEDGRIDYKNANKAPGLACFVRCDDKILLLKRSDKVLAAKNKWYVVAGFLDEEKSLIKKVKEELKEEVGIQEDQITNITLAEPWEYKDEAAKKTWIQFPILVDLKTLPEITLDWEHTEYKWVLLHEIFMYDTPDSLTTSLRKLEKYWQAY